MMNIRNQAWNQLLLLEKKSKNTKKITMNTKREWLVVMMMHLFVHILGLGEFLITHHCKWGIPFEQIYSDHWYLVNEIWS
jgi:hypothetical protein